MQVPVYGNMISVKNLKKCLSQLNDDRYLIVDKYGNLAICKIEKFENGNIKELKSKFLINFYSEEIMSQENFKENLKSEYGNN